MLERIDLRRLLIWLDWIMFFFFMIFDIKVIFIKIITTTFDGLLFIYIYIIFILC